MDAGTVGRGVERIFCGVVTDADMLTADRTSETAALALTVFPAAFDETGGIGGIDPGFGLAAVAFTDTGTGYLAV